MDGLNQRFAGDPLAFLARHAVNNILWWSQRHLQMHRESWLRHCVLEAAGEGWFDLSAGPGGQTVLKPVSDRGCGEPPIGAYWCPFIQGGGLPGFVEIPARHPRHVFVFTAAMNGCSLDITRSPRARDMLRVYHNQHPGQALCTRKILQQGEPILASVGFDRYGDPTLRQPAPNAFNLLYYTGGRWQCLVQPQQLDMFSQHVQRHPRMPPGLIDLRLDDAVRRA